TAPNHPVQGAGAGTAAHDPHGLDGVVRHVGVAAAGFGDSLYRTLQPRVANARRTALRLDSFALRDTLGGDRSLSSGDVAKRAKGEFAAPVAASRSCRGSRSE